MDLAKFSSLLQSRSLHFNRLDKFDDPFEGSIPLRLQQAKIIQEKQIDSNLPIGKQKSNFASQLTESNLLQRKRIYVNCWHMNETESAAMWSLYSLSNQGICIASKYQNLADSLSDDIFLGSVKYIDYEKEIFPADNLLHLCMHKRRSFEHEKEVRAVIWGLGADSTHRVPEIMDPPGGLVEPLVLEDLIEQVLVHPESPDWFLNVVINLVEKYNLPIKVKRSGLASSPIL